MAVDLPAPFGPEQREQFAAVDREIESVEGRDLAEAFADARRGWRAGSATCFLRWAGSMSQAPRVTKSQPVSRTR